MSTINSDKHNAKHGVRSGPECRERKRAERGRVNMTGRLPGILSSYESTVIWYRKIEMVLPICWIRRQKFQPYPGESISIQRDITVPEQKL